MYAHRAANRFVQASIDVTYAGDLTVLSCAEIQCAGLNESYFVVQNKN